MKRTLELQTPDPGEPGVAPGLRERIPMLPRIDGGLQAGRKSHLRVTDVASRTVPKLTGWLVAIAVCACLTGCFGFLKPALPVARHFVLTALPPPAGPVTTTPDAGSVGVGPVRLPSYLFDTSLAVRKGTNEIDYLPWALWAERLDKGVQRLLAENLSTLLAPAQIRLTAWRSTDVSTEVYVAIGQFDVDAGGHGILVAWWRIVSPGGEKTLKAGESRFERQGPSPNTDPAGAIATLSELFADFSRQLAQVIKETTPTLR
jgi:hypothetical protein